MLRFLCWAFGFCTPVFGQIRPQAKNIQAFSYQPIVPFLRTKPYIEARARPDFRPIEPQQSQRRFHRSRERLMFSENLEQLELVGPDAHSVVDSTTIWLTSMAAAITVGFFLSPMPEVLRVWRGVTHFDSLHIDSLLLMWLNSLLWVLYSVLINLPSNIPHNCVGLAFASMYIFVWLGRAKGDLRDDGWRKIRVTVILVFASVTFGAFRLELLESLVTLVNLSMFGAPLLRIRVVLTERSSAALARPTCVAGALCCILWLLLGIHLQNNAMIIPNAVGTALNLIQVGLCVVFPRQSKSAMPLRVQEPTTEAASRVSKLDGILINVRAAVLRRFGVPEYVEDLSERLGSSRTSFSSAASTQPILPQFSTPVAWEDSEEGF